MSANTRPLLLRRLLTAADLSPSALTLGLVLLTRTDDPTMPFVCFYDDLAVRMGPRRRGAAAGSRAAVADAAAELVAAGIVARERKANSLGRTDGPATPYLWSFTPDDASAERDGRWKAWTDAVIGAVSIAPKFGPVAIATYARAAFAADARGVLCATLPELKTMTRLEHKTAEKHLVALAGVGALRVAQRLAERRLVVLEFAIVAPPSPEEEGALVGRITAAHNRTKRRRAQGKPYPLALPPVVPAANDIAEAMNELAGASTSEAASLLRQIIAAMEAGRRSFTVGQICEGFVAPVLAEQLRRGNDRAFAERALRKILRRARKTNEPPIGNFASYFASVAKSEPRFLTKKNPRRLLARDEEGHPFYLANVLRSARSR